MNIQQYFQRIGYTGPGDTTLETLSQLQLMHLLHVPFENLDIQNHIAIDLDHLFEKIVINKRGGFCYELNGLFYQMLTAIGFTTKMISARVFNAKTKTYSPEFDHMAIIVSLDNARYLVDVGFGEFALSPIIIETGKETADPRGIFRIEMSDENHKAVSKKNAQGTFVPEYIFSEKERRMEEFYTRCQYHQTDPASHFMQKRICSLPTQNGRITLTDDTLKITESGTLTETRLQTEQAVLQILWNYFGIRPST